MPGCSPSVPGGPLLTSVIAAPAEHELEESGSKHDSYGIRGATAYFSMEIGLDPAIPTYSGGLGVLAGDTLRAAADLGVPMVGITLIHHKGFFRQHLDAVGSQSESPYDWDPAKYLEPLPQRVSIIIEGRPVQIRAWRYVATGATGHEVPIYLLDTALEENGAWDRALTDTLYGGDQRYRVCQEMVLGLGGVAMLHQLGFDDVKTFHMNEGHSALLTLALLEEELERPGARTLADAERAVRQRCVFTTHTPVRAGHDQFALDLAREALGDERYEMAAEHATNGVWDMTRLALALSHYVNGVSERHHRVSQELFPEYSISAVTNGVHAGTWTSPPFAALFDRHIPRWRQDNLYLRSAATIPLEEIQKAHAQAKRDLATEVMLRSGATLDPRLMTIGFARRATAYKRIDLIFSDLDRLRHIVSGAGPLQIVYGGKAHPHDDGGKELIRRVFEAKEELKDSTRIVFLEEYDIALGKLLTAGVDLWLNTPQKPLEASGTSGMKAALNGVPSLSVLDGWWIEGHVEGVTGWSIGDSAETGTDEAVEIESMYDKLEYVILPTYYGRPKAFAQVMRSAIALNGSFFNTQRMVLQYVRNAYEAPHGSSDGLTPSALAD